MKPFVIAKLKPVLFATLVFSFGMGTTHAEVCPSHSTGEIKNMLQSVLIKGDHEKGDSVECRYSQNISESMRSNYAHIITPDIKPFLSHSSWIDTDNVQTCDAKKNDCSFTAKNEDGTLVSVVTKSEVPTYEEKYNEILENFNQCKKDGRFNCESIKTAAIAQLKMDCMLGYVKDCPAQ